MSDAEDRIARLERKVATVEILHAQAERKAEGIRPPAQVHNIEEINEKSHYL